jgi:hypothetical protein
MGHSLGAVPWDSEKRAQLARLGQMGQMGQTGHRAMTGDNKPSRGYNYAPRALRVDAAAVSERRNSFDVILGEKR